MSSYNSPSITLLATVKPQAFCSSLFKSDEELRNSFDSFFANHTISFSEAEKERILNDYKALYELLSVLPEVSSDGVSKEIPQADCGNRLFASLKRHPE